MTAALDLATPKSIHLVGIGGVGMCAIAEALVGMGHQVSGSDIKESAGLERLVALGIDVSIGQAPDQVRNVDAVAVSTAIPDDNIEVVAARDRDIAVLHRSQVLAAMTRTRKTVAVAGTHGKTTTASMLASSLRAAGLAPSFVIGGDLNETGSGAGWGAGEWFIVEADESDGTFLALEADLAVVTSVEPDHIEHYGGVDEMVAAFERFLAQSPGGSLVCADDEIAATLGERHGSMTYGTAASADYRMVDVELDATTVSFAVERCGRRLGKVQLPVPGIHNARNACAALAAATLAGAEVNPVLEALANFAGVARRFEFRGEAGGVTFVDDYAHLPTEVRVVLETAQQGDWGRVVCVFQPHRFSRTAALWQDFADAFPGADLLIVTDVYGAGEKPRPGISGKLVADAALEHHPWCRLAYLPHRDDLIDFLTSELRPGDLCLTLGAGDLTTIPTIVMDRR